jgi:type IV secretory pathway VirB2 component (pilin)
MPWMARPTIGPGRYIGRAKQKGSIMKHITGAALRVAALAVVAVTGLALLAGKDDIRKFHRMRSM